MTDALPKPDEITPAELKLITRLMILAPSREQRAARVRRAIETQGKAMAIIGRGGDHRPVTYAAAFEMVYGSPL